MFIKENDDGCSRPIYNACKRMRYLLFLVAFAYPFFEVTYFLGMRQKLQADFLGLYTFSAKKPHHITHSVIFLKKKTVSLYKAIPGISLA